MTCITEQLFKYNQYYLSDYAGNIAGPFNTFDEACKVAVESDTILQTFAPKVTKKSTVTAITIDFSKNEIVVEGDAATLNKVCYDAGVTHSIDKEELKDWEKIIADSYSVCNNVLVVGQPPIEGDYLNEMLHL